MNISKPDKCLRCGKCCHYWENGIYKKCPYLLCGKQKTLCTIYERRIGKRLGNSHVCTFRDNVAFDYEGCPYNTSKPMMLEPLNKQQLEVIKNELKN